MAEPLSPDQTHRMGPRSDAGPTWRPKKRSAIACRRCHGHKVKCSGGIPCQRCQKARKGSSCEYTPRERRVAVSESYLKQLQADNHLDSDPIREPDPDHQLRDTDSSQSLQAMESRAPSQPPPADRDINNPLHEPQILFQLDQASQQHFVGESTCTAFGDHLLQCIHPQGTPTSMPSGYRYVQNPAFARQLGTPAGCKLPDRIRANLLVRVATRFIGQDYHFFLQEDFLQQLDAAYSSRDMEDCDPIWACKFFVVLALGELYSTTTPTMPPHQTDSQSVPGTDYFLSAVNLLQDQFEEPTTANIETMLLFCFYSNALGRVKSAHMYSGIALRLSTSLGLHRSIDKCVNLTPVEREHRIRLWWTVYIFDRSTSSKLGQPLSIQDTDIEVEMPSWETLASDARQKFSSPEHLLANIELSRITGCIMRDIYGLSSKDSRGSFVHNVRSILKKLKKWDANVAPSLRLSQGAAHRPVASLQLHFNQCIILTTRPILLHVLKTKNPFANPTVPPGESITPPISDTARMLADSCISAARTSNSIVSQLYIENALATYGYFDAHHLFSSTLILIISAIISPNSSDSDAVQTSFYLLKTMRDNGNMAASQYYSRLAHIQWSVGRLRTRVTAKETNVSNTATSNQAITTPVSLPDPPLLDTTEFENYDWSNFLVPSAPVENYDWNGLGNVYVDPLDNPLLQTFLDHTDASWDEHLGLSTEDRSYVL